MTIVNGYCSLDELVLFAKDPAGAGGDRAPAYEWAISSASRAVDDHCQRTFYSVAAPTARKYTPPNEPRDILPVDDFSTTVGLVVVDTTNTLTLDTSFQVEPQGPQGALVGFPFTGLRPLAWWWLYPVYAGLYTVTVTAKWGWAAIPDPVKQATLILANRNMARSGAPLGVVGFDTFGSVRVTPIDKDVVELLRPYRRGDTAFGLA